MSILLLILKIIGMILLVLLCLILLILALVLFVPVTYKATTTFCETDISKSSISLRLSWMYPVIRLLFLYKDQKASSYVQIFWFKKDLHADNIVRKTEDTKTEDTKTDDTTEEFASSEEHKASEEANASEAFESSKEFEGFDEEILSEPAPFYEPEQSTEYAEDKSKSGKINRTKDNLSHRYVNFTEKIKHVRSSFKKIREELSDENNKAALLQIKEALIYLCRHYGPRRIQGQLRFSLADPAYTGLACGVISIFPLMYRKGFSLFPDFESDNIYLEGNLMIFGRIRGIHILVVFIKLFRNKATRRIIRKYIK